MPGVKSGERAASSGYGKQYEEFARQVYACIRKQILVEIRVADTEENVGKLDDICYVTKTEVHAYQIKTTISGQKIGYGDLKEWMPGILQGWYYLQNRYIDKTVYPYLWSDMKIAPSSPVLNSTGTKIGTVTQFVNALEKYKRGKSISEEWKSLIHELESECETKKEISLTEDEWTTFWQRFDFQTERTFEKLSVAHAVSNKKTADLFALTNLIRAIASDEHVSNAVCSYEEIESELGLKYRINPNYKHDLIVNELEYEPISKAIGLLNAALKDKTKGYLFLEGAPGSGKSTILTKWAQSIPNTTIPYYAFDFTQPSHHLEHDYKRGESEIFLFDLVKALIKKGFETKDDTLPYKDEAFLQQQFKELLQSISEKYEATKVPTIIIVDGLDHVHREYTTIHGASLLKVLPSIDDFPEGVIFVLGSQYYEKLGLDEDTIAAYRRGEGVVKMPSFTKDEVGRLAKKFLGLSTISKETINALMRKSSGHPLHLRYIFNQLLADPSVTIESIPDYKEDIEIYYRRITKEVSENAECLRYLGLLARVPGDIKDEFVRVWDIKPETHRIVLKQMGHLFNHNKKIQTRTFFHNSFKQFLLRETAYDYIAEEYNETTDRAYYKQLAAFTKKPEVKFKWDLGFYLYRAGEDEEFKRQITPEHLIDQIHHFRPIWHVQRDVEYAAQVAARQQDAYMMVRMLFLQRQIDDMMNITYDSASLVRDLLQLREEDIAKRQVRDGRELYCTNEDVLSLSRYFYAYGDTQEAAFLYESSTLPTLGQLKDNTHERNNVIRRYIRELREWASTAPYFEEIPKIEERLQQAKNHMGVMLGEEELDKDRVINDIRFHIIVSLINQERYGEIEQVVQLYEKEVQPKVRFKAQLEKLTYRLYAGIDRSALKEEYKELQERLGEFNEAIPDETYLKLAVLGQNVGADKETIAGYMANVRWGKLDSISHWDRSEERFEKLEQRIQYVEMRTFLGHDDDLEQLAPNALKDAGLYALVQYLRIVYHLAQLKMKAQREGQTDAEFMGVAKRYLKFADTYEWMGSNDYAYMFREQRGDFNVYFVRVALKYGIETVCKVRDIVQYMLDTGEWHYKMKGLRELVYALRKAGVEHKWAVSILEKIEAEICDGREKYEKQEEAYEQGQAWMRLGENERALKSFSRMIVESFGVEERKDYQPTRFAKWINIANQADPAHAKERIYWLTTRIRSISESCASRTADSAGKMLFRGTFALNKGMGVQLGEWLHGTEAVYFESLSSEFIEELLTQMSTEEEYKMVFRYYTQLHLCTMGDWSDVDTTLLEKIYEKGTEICGAGFEAYKVELRRSICTICYEKARETMLSRLDRLEHPDEENERIDRSVLHHESDDMLEEAKALLRNGERRAAWEKAMQALSKSNAYGWSRWLDSGTRLRVCEFLKSIDAEEGKRIAIQQMADDVSMGASDAVLGDLEEIMQLMDDNVDPIRLYIEELGYMSHILREDTVNEDDKPSLNATDDGMIEAMVKWLIFVQGVYKGGVDEKAKMLLAEMMKDGCAVLSIMQEEKCEVHNLLEIGMYARELGASLTAYKELAMENAESLNYAVRRYARVILKELGEPVKDVDERLANIVKTKDFSIIKVQAQPKPDFIPRMAGKNEWKMPDGWEYEAQKCKRLKGPLPQIEGRYVIGEYTLQCKPGDTPAYEDFSMKICIGKEIGDTGVFYNNGENEIIYRRTGNNVSYDIIEERLMLNPKMAERFGWRPAELGNEAWVDENGELMVESVYWLNGSIYFTGRSTIEAGEGWYVVATEKGMERLRTLGDLYVHRMTTRRAQSLYLDPYSGAQKIQEVR